MHDGIAHTQTCECTPSLSTCADDGGTCACSGNVRYGAGSQWTEAKFSPGRIGCNTGTFIDPAGASVKKVQRSSVSCMRILFL
jgi:hypothetical protein